MAEPMSHMPRPDHWDGRRFFNPTAVPTPPWSSLARLWLTPRAHQAPPAPAPPPLIPLAGEAAVVTFIGHASFLVQTAAGHVLLDPVFSERIGPWGVIGHRRLRPPGLRLEALPPVSLVLISHVHYDHCDLGTLRELSQRWRPLIIVPLGGGRVLRKAGVTPYEELDWWGTSREAPIPVTLTPAQHCSARSLFDRNRALWGGFVCQIANRSLFFAGDTGYAVHFAAIRERCGPMDLSLLPIGAYEPRHLTRHVHMNPDDAVQAHLDLESAVSIGMHFGTFAQTLEGLDDPPVALREARRARGVADDAFITMAHGGAFRLR